jgi:hypothetical protein
MAAGRHSPIPPLYPPQQPAWMGGTDNGAISPAMFGGGGGGGTGLAIANDGTMWFQVPRGGLEWATMPQLAPQQQQQHYQQQLDDDSFNSSNNALNRGRWSMEEHSRYKEGLETYGQDWGTISGMIGTRSPTQVRSHHSKVNVRTDPPLTTTGASQDAAAAKSMASEALVELSNSRPGSPTKSGTSSRPPSPMKDNSSPHGHSVFDSAVRAGGGEAAPTTS